VRPGVKRSLLLAAALMSGCETPDKPPLPKFALGAAPPKATDDEKWTTTVERADVEITGGASLTANIALVRNNAHLGAAIAIAFAG